MVEAATYGSRFALEALDSVSKLMCIWEGVIQFMTPDEFTVIVP